MTSYLVPPPGTQHGPNEPVSPARPVIVVDQRGVEHVGLLRDQMWWATGWRCRVTHADAMGLTGGGWFPAEAIRVRSPGSDGAGLALEHL